jgi:hypothetical protein
MSTTHTPGPWAYDQEEDNSTDFWVFQENGPARIAVEVSERDAALIAAAPDMLAVLKQVADYWAGGDVPAEIDAAMRAAIAKATGV